MHVGLVVFGDVDYGLDLANLLHQGGLRVSLYMSYARVAAAVDSPDDPEARIREAGLVNPAVSLRLFRLPRLRDPRSFLVIRRLRQSMRDDGVDLAHVLMGPVEVWVAVLANLLRDVPVVSTMIIPKPNIGGPVPACIELAISRLLTWGSDVIIVNGADQIELVQRLYGVSTTRIEYVPLGARTTAARWPGTKNPEEPGTVLFFGKVQRRKGLEYLVRAQPAIASQVPHSRIIIAGEGEDLARCRTMIKDEAGFETHEGFVPADKARTYFERACVVALPYVSASTSGILTTAYVFGKPVVATSVGCLPEYVQDGETGVLVPPGDVEQLAAAVVRLLSDDSLRRRLGDNAKQWISTRERLVTSRLLATYERAVAVHGMRDGRRHWAVESDPALAYANEKHVSDQKHSETEGLR